MESANATKEITLADYSKEIIMHHLSSFHNNDLEEVVSDYIDESVLITPDATYTGPEEIRTFFVGLMRYFPKQRSSFELDRLTVNGELAYIVWHAKTPNLNVPLGSDTFIIKGSKIYQQTFVGQLNYLD